MIAITTMAIPPAIYSLINLRFLHRLHQGQSEPD